MTIREICELFDVRGKFVECKEISTGNVNGTFSVDYINEQEKSQYVIQHINKFAFKNPPEVMQNIVRVTSHIRKKLNDAEEQKGVLKVYTAKQSGLPYIIDDVGEYWRCYRFIKDSVTYDSCESLEMVKSVGCAFGEFQCALEDFDAKSLFVTIPDFHNTIKRYKDFYSAIQLDSLDRVKNVKCAVDELIKLEEKACLLQKHIDDGKIPLRVTHNDTKCNNVCFDKNTGKVLAVLDLDTVMPGAIAHDFGDGIRFIANTVLEDDPHLEKVGLDLDKYTAFAEGFIGQVKDAITPFELESMNLGVLAMAVELSVRFLTDYILGDKYFKTKYPGHNVDRAVNQLALAKDIDAKWGQIEKILHKYF